MKNTSKPKNHSKPKPILTPSKLSVAPVLPIDDKTKVTAVTSNEEIDDDAPVTSKRNNKPKPAPFSRRSPPNEELDAYIKIILDGGGYVDPELLYIELVPRVPHLKHSHRFRQLQYVHLNVTAAIDVYIYCNVIRTLSGLEEFLMKDMERVHKGTLTNFLDLGVGFLHQHPKVVELFGKIEDPKNLMPISPGDIVALAVRFSSKKKNIWASDKVKLNYDFLQFARKALECHGHTVALHVDFFVLRHKTRRLFDEQQLITKVLEKHSRERELEVQQSVNNLLQQCAGDGRMGFVKRLMKAEGVDVREEYIRLKSMLNANVSQLVSGAGVEVSPFRLHMLQFFTRVLPIRAVYDKSSKTLTENVDADTFFSMLDNPSYLGNLFFVCRQDKKSIDRHLFAVALLSLALYWTCPHVELIISTVSEFTEKLQAILREHFGDDLSAEILNIVQAYLLDKCKVGKILSSEIDPLSKEKKLRFAKLLNSVEARLNVEGRNLHVVSLAPQTHEPPSAPKHEFAFGYSGSDYVAIACSAELFCRVMRAEVSPDAGVLSPNSTEDGMKELIISMKPCDEPIQLVNTIDELSSALSQSTLSYLSAVGEEITDRLSVPAFECVANGNISFLKYLSNLNNGEYLKNYYRKILGANTSVLSIRDGDESDGEGTYASPAEITIELLWRIVYEFENLLVSLPGEQEDLGLSGDTAIIRVLCELEKLVSAELECSFEKSYNRTFLSVLFEGAFGELQVSPRLRELLQTLGCCGKSASADGLAFGRTDILYPKVTENVVMFSSIFSVPINVFERLLCGYFSACSPSPQFKTDVAFSAYLADVLQPLCLTSEQLEDTVWKNFCCELGGKLKSGGNVSRYFAFDTSLSPLLDPVLSFFGHDLVSSLSGAAAVKFDTSAFRSLDADIIGLIASTPLGESCRAFCLWDDLVDCMTPTPSLLCFVIQNEEELKRLRPNIRLVSFDVSIDDCIPLPTQDPVYLEVSNAFAEQEYGTIAAWCLAAVVGSIERDAFLRKSLNAYFLSELESRGSAGVDYLLHLILCVAVSCLPSLRAHVFVLCLQSVSVASKLSVETVQTHLWNGLLSTTSSGLTSLSERIKMIVAVSRRSEELSVLRAHIPNLIARLLSVSHADPAPMILTEAGSMIRIDEPSGVVESISRPMSDAPATATTGSFLVRQDDLMDCRAFVEELLESDFSLPQDSPMAKKLQNALEKIAADLYSSDVHFVMELVQNADDNLYDGSAIPTLKMDLYAHAMVIYNNEIGFLPENIRAICNVGGSTKAGQMGYIGQKGIGFKSVFSVSDCPEIHSNGFHIRFERNNMIEPIWIDEVTSKWPEHQCDEEYFGTIIRLKLDQRACQNYAKLNENLESAFEGKLLLFLNKLMKMQLEDKNTNRRMEHTKIVLTHSWVKMAANYVNYPLKHADEGDSFWFVRRKSFHPQIDRNKVCVDSTEIAIAIPFKLTKIEEIDDHLKSMIDTSYEAGCNVLEQQIYTYELQPVFDQAFPVYAFLPTKEHIFRFIIQGDYLLSSSREAIQEGDLHIGYEWNRGLIETTVGLAVDVFRELFGKAWNLKFGEENDCSNLDQLVSKNHSILVEPRQVLGLLPRLDLRGQSPLFQLFSQQFYAALGQSPFLRSREGQELIPAADAISTHHLNFNPRDFLSEALLFECTKRRFFDDSIELDAELVGLLGIPVFTETTVLQCAIYLKAQVKESGHIDVPELAGILLMLVKFSDLPSEQNPLRDKKPSIVPSQVVRRTKVAGSTSVSANTMLTVVDKLKALRIWPSAGGDVISLAENSLFVTSSGLFTDAQTCCIDTFKHLLPMLDERVLIEAERIMPSGGKDLMLNFFSVYMRASRVKHCGGLEEMTSEMIIKECIVPYYERGVTLSTTDRALCAAFVAFIFLAINARSKNNGTSAQQAALEKFIGKTNVIAPVCIMNANQNSWQYSHVRRVKKGRCEHKTDTVVDIEVCDVHFGLEVADAALVKLAANLNTAVRQLSFCMLDPLCAAFASGNQQLISRYVNCSFMFPNNKGLSGEIFSGNQEKNWRSFLLGIGVVNFFNAKEALSLTSAEVTSSVGAGLIQFLQHITRSAEIISTSTLPSHAVSYAEHKESSNGTVEVFSSGSVALPLFLNFPEDKAVRVSKEVYQTINVVVMLLVSELGSLTNSYSEIPPFLAFLNQFAWFPAYVHRYLWSDEEPYYVLTSPRNIFVEESSIDSDQWHRATDIHSPFGPQVLFLAGSLHSTMQRCGLLRGAFSFIWYQRDNRWVSMNNDTFLTLLEWMINSQKDHECYSSEAIMTSAYKELFVIADRARLNGDDKTLDKIRSLLSDHCIWVPCEKYSPDSYDDNRRSEIQRGAFYPVRVFVKTDPSEKFGELVGGPLKLIKDYYAPEDAQKLEKLFSRKRYCSVCKAVEGLFGVRGGPIEPVRRLYNNGELKCCCVDQGFGSFLNGGGLMKASPDIEDIVNLLRYHGCLLRQIISKRGSGEKTWSYEDLLPIKQVLTELSANVWKCFHIPLALHPYSADSLRKLKGVFVAEEVLPTLDSNFARASAVDIDKNQGQICIAVDSEFLWDLFRDHLSVLAASDSSADDHTGSTRFVYLDALPLKGSVDLIIDEEKIEYDLSVIEEDVASLLQHTKLDFESRTDFLPQKTFFAPRNLNSLFDFLGVATLSSYIVDDWKAVPVDETSVGYSFDSSGFTRTMNKILLIAQSFIFTHRRDVMMQLERMQRFCALQALVVVECISLRRKAVLNVDDIIIEKESPVLYYYDADLLKIYIDCNISKADLHLLCIATLMRTLRTDIAQINQKQDVERMRNLEEILNKMVNIDASGISGAMQMQELQSLPDGVELWMLKGTRVDSTQVDDDSVNGESSGAVPISDDLLEAARAGYQETKAGWSAS